MTAPEEPGTHTGDTPDAEETPQAQAAAAAAAEAGASDTGGSESGASDTGASGDTGAPETPATGLGAELQALRSELDERTRDLQRISAEYANYRKRVDRDKALASEEATASVLRALLPVLDDFDRARAHGDLTEGVSTIVDQLVATVGKFGLTPVGEPGDAFDPNHHEAVAHRTSPDVTGPTCVEVLRRGYLLGDRLLRPAMVAVAEPGEEPEPAAPADATAPAADVPAADDAERAGEDHGATGEATAGDAGGDTGGEEALAGGDALTQAERAEAETAEAQAAEAPRAEAPAAGGTPESDTTPASQDTPATGETPEQDPASETPGAAEG